jgi:hypothetical protein
LSQVLGFLGRKRTDEPTTTLLEPGADKLMDIGVPETEHEIEVVPLEEPVPGPAPVEEPVDDPVPA